MTTDHPSGQPEVDVPSLLDKLIAMQPSRSTLELDWKASAGWQCAVCLNLIANDPEGSPWPAVTLANGSAVCAAHVEDAFGLEDKVRMQRNMRREARMAELRGQLGSP